MARKQSDYLAALLADEAVETKSEGGISADGAPASAPPAPSPAPPRGERMRGTTLLGRESALARVVSGEVRQVTQLLLDPARVRVWPGNARSYQHLSEESEGRIQCQLYPSMQLGGTPAKLADMAYTAQQVARYVAWERTVWFDTNKTPGETDDGDTAQRGNEAVLKSAEKRLMSYSAAIQPFTAADIDGNANTSSNHSLWRWTHGGGAKPMTAIRPNRIEALAGVSNASGRTAT